jgi:hypothetical protein
MIDMFRKKPILKYNSTLPEYPDAITPAKKHVPEWYKKIPRFRGGKIFSIKDGYNPTVKLCVPFLDSLTTGYMITLPYDIYVAIQENGQPWVTWPPGVLDVNQISKRPVVADKNIVPFEHYDTEFTWNYCVSYTFPKGYSCILTHPFNRHDLPFTTMTGIIDGGIVMTAHGKVPFYIKKNFEGIIPQGTPIAQLVPFRQENWKSKKIKNLEVEGLIHNGSAGHKFYGWYKNTFWVRKQYE